MVGLGRVTRRTTCGPSRTVDESTRESRADGTRGPVRARIPVPGSDRTEGQISLDTHRKLVSAPLRLGILLGEIPGSTVGAVGTAPHHPRDPRRLNSGTRLSVRCCGRPYRLTAGKWVYTGEDPYETSGAWIDRTEQH